MHPHTRNEIVRRWYAGQSMRSIAATMNVSRKTVKRALAEHDERRRAGADPFPSKRRESLVDPYLETIRELLGRYPEITVKRLFEELRQRGYTGGYTTLCNRVRELRHSSRKPWVERFETAPGAQAQMDYAVYTIDFTYEGRRRVNLFSYILGYSRRQYLRFVESQDLQTTLREHIRAFEHLGGVAATCLYDNMKTVVTRYEEGAPLYNTRFLAFATHYGFRPVACAPRRPQTKGKVERPFDYVEKNLLNGRTFRSLEHLNQVTAWWLAEVADVRTHGTTGERPADRHAEERPHLIPLPEKPYEVADVTYCTVDAEGFITYARNRYSVPWQATSPGQVLPVKATDEEVVVYGPHIDEIARHSRFPSTVTRQKREEKAHRPPQNVTRRRERLKERFAELGEPAVAFLERLLAAKRQGWRQAELILALTATYRRDDLLAALERATRYGAFSVTAVERILAVQAKPKTAWDHLAERGQEHLERSFDTEPTPPRPTADYQHLLFPRGEERVDDDLPSTQKETPTDDPPQEDQEPSDQEPSDQEPSDEEPSDEEPSDEEPSDENRFGEEHHEKTGCDEASFQETGLDEAEHDAGRPSDGGEESHGEGDVREEPHGEDAEEQPDEQQPNEQEEHLGSDERRDQTNRSDESGRARESDDAEPA